MYTFTKKHKQTRHWGFWKRSMLVLSIFTFLVSSFMYLTPAGEKIRLFLADTVITTQHRSWAWILVGAKKRDEMVQALHDTSELNAEEKQNLDAIRLSHTKDKLVQVTDISGTYWKGKKMIVSDPKAIRVVVPNHKGEGEHISSMVTRTGAIAGVNAGGFVDPEGLGNGFAPIGTIMSGGEFLYTDTDSTTKQHIVGFTDEGTLVIGKYSANELKSMNVQEAVSFYPRVIANGKPLITEGDGGWGRAPRTAVGQRADGTVEFVVIDGRQNSSIGATLREVQDLLLADGCINAGFLDGGASSELVVDGKVVTNPSSRYGERRLPSGFLIFENPDKVKVDNIWSGETQIDPGGRYDHPDYIKEQESKKNSKKPQA